MGVTDIAISVVTLIELARGVARANTAERKEKRQQFLHELQSAVPIHPVTLQKLQTAKSGMGAKLKCSSAAFLESHFNCCPLNLASYAAMPWSMYWEPYFTMR